RRGHRDIVLDPDGHVGRVDDALGGECKPGHLTAAESACSLIPASGCAIAGGGSCLRCHSCEVPGSGGTPAGPCGGRACCQDEAGADECGSGDEEYAQRVLACASAGGAERTTHIRRTRQPGQSVSRFAKWLPDRYRRRSIRMPGWDG